MASTWDHERDKQLLVAILAVHSPLDFAAIAKAMGQGDSTAAVRQHVHALKARQEGTSKQSPTKDKTDKTDKPTARARKVTKPTTKRKNASATNPEKDSAVEGQNSDGDEPCPSPTKQRKL